MRVAVVFPPSLCLPNQLYFSLPVLAGALKRGGHEAQISDLNLMAADRFLTEPVTQRVFGQACEQVLGLFQRGAILEADALRDTFDGLEPELMRGPGSKALLRDPERAYDQRAFREAFWNVVDCLGFFHQLDPVFTPYRPQFGRDMVAYQTADPWTPLQDLYEEHLLDAVLDREPELLALSVAFPEQSAEAVRFARRVRARAPDLHIAMGGPLITKHAAKWLEDDWIFAFADSLCVGDGEATIVQLADALEGRGGLDGVRNLVWRDERGVVRRNDETPQLVRFDEIPVPDFDSADMALSFLPEPIWPLMVSRGCYWGRCTFCQIGWRENFRQAAEDKIRQDVVDLKRRYGARYVQLQDSSIPPAAAKILARVIKEEGLDITWVSGMKFEACHLDRDYVQGLADGGCRSLLMGFETANQRLLDLMDKGVSIADVPAMLTNLRDAGISAEMLWFTGFPTETRGEALHTMRFLEQQRGRYGLSAFVAEYQLHPDTMVHDRPADFGVTITSELNGSCTYETASGMQLADLGFIERRMAETNNRTLVCNGSHVIHASQGVPYRGLARELVVPADVVAFCDGTRAANEPEPKLPAPATNVGSPGSFGSHGETSAAHHPTVKLTPPPEEIPARAAPGLPRAPFLDDDFGFRSALEARWREVLAEWQALQLEDVRAWPEQGAADGKWGIFGLNLAGHPVPVNRNRCPVTAELLDDIPGLYTAGFSVLGPRSRLPLHFGEAEHVFRCHLPLVIPPGCGIRVAGVEHIWTPGRTVAFEDVLLHRAWNDSDEHKVLLLIDVLKPRALSPKDYDFDLWHHRERVAYSDRFPDWAR
jgi:hypothetical protein